MTAFGFLADGAPAGFWMPVQASDFAQNVDALFYFILYISIFFFVLLMGLSTYWAYKYRARPEHTRSGSVSHHFQLEFLWSAVPSVILLIVFAWGFKDFSALSATPSDALQLRVVGQKWAWTVSYPELDRECTSTSFGEGDDQENIVEFYLPVNRPFTVQMSSEDVIHSFWIPAFRVKRDVVPNRYTGFTVTPTQTGDFPLYCAEFCGTQHSVMKGVVRVLSEEDWEKKFLQTDRCKLDESDPAYPSKLFSKYGCNACHVTTDGAPVTVGPNLFGIAKESTVETTAGAVEMSDDYLRESLLEPQAKIVKGFEGQTMPSFKGRLTEKEISTLIDYIKSLQ